MPCPALPLDGPFISGVLAHIDCQAQAIGQGGYQALAAPGSAISIMLTGLLTIFVALFGYRMLLGETPSVRDGTLAAAKLGMVLLLATNWPSFRVLAYDVAMHGPAELAGVIGRAADLPGRNGGLVDQLQQVDYQLTELVQLGTGKPPGMEALQPASPPMAIAPQFSPQLQQLRQQNAQMLAQAQAQEKPRWDPQRDAAIVAEGRTLYLAGAIAAFASVRLIAGVLLALGPLFALFLLFRATRGLFEGWVRALSGAALGALVTAILLGVQVALMRPWLDAILVERHAGTPTPQVPAELLALTLIFGLALLAALVATAVVAKGFRMTDTPRWSQAQTVMATGNQHVVAPPFPEAGPGAADQRARAVANGIAAVQRREAPATASFHGASRGPAPSTIAGPAMAPAAASPGQSGRRRTHGRVSASAQRRDVGV